MVRMVAGLRGLLWYAVAIPVLLLASLVAEQIAWLRAPDAFFTQVPGSQALLVGLCIGLGVGGGLLLVFAQFLVRRPAEPEIAAMGEGVEASWSSMHHGEVEELVARNRLRAMAPAVWKSYRYRHGGPAIGRAYSISAPVRAMKEAWASGQWWQNPAWRTGFFAILGGFLMLLGLLGLPIVLGPPLVRLLCGGALVYVLGRTAWALYRA